MNTPQVDIEDPVIQAVLHSLDAQTSQYSVATQIRLNEARARAIAATRANVPFWRNRSILAAAFAASAAFTFVMLTQPDRGASSAEIEAIALFEATFGAQIVERDLSQTAVVETEVFFDAVGDEAIVANDLEFYAWLSETTSAERASANTPAGSGS